MGQKNILPLNVSRCWGLSGSRACPKRDNCKRYLGRKERGDGEFPKFPLSVDRMCVVTFHGFMANDPGMKP